MTDQQRAYQDACTLAAESIDLDGRQKARIALAIAMRYRLSAAKARKVAAEAIRAERGRRNPIRKER